MSACRRTRTVGAHARTVSAIAVDKTLQLRLKAMHLPSFLENYVELAERGTAESWSHVRYLTELVALEAEDCADRRMTRLLREAKLPREKTVATLFALLAERYERKSVMITSNLVFSKWDQIFKDPMTTRRPLIGSCITRSYWSSWVVTASDAEGRVIASKMDSPAGPPMIVADLPLGTGPTVYTRIGDIFAWVCAAYVLCLGAYPISLRKPSSTARRDVYTDSI